MLPRVLKVTSAVYPHLVINSDFSYFSFKSWPIQVRILKPSLEHYHGYPSSPSNFETNQSRGFIVMIGNINRQTKGDYYFIYRGVRYFPKGIFSRITYPVATSQMCNFPCGNFPKVRLSPLRPAGCNGGRALHLDGLGGRAQLQEQTGKPSVASLTDLESWRLGNCIVGKLPHGKTLGKVLNIYIEMHSEHTSSIKLN